MFVIFFFVLLVFYQRIINLKDGIIIANQKQVIEIKILNKVSNPKCF